MVNVTVAVPPVRFAALFVGAIDTPMKRVSVPPFPAAVISAEFAMVSPGLEVAILAKEPTPLGVVELFAVAERNTAMFVPAKLVETYAVIEEELVELWLVYTGVKL